MRNVCKLFVVDFEYRNKTLSAEILVTTERDQKADISIYHPDIQRAISRGDMDVVVVTVEGRVMKSPLPALVGDTAEGVLFADEKNILEFVHKKGMIEETFRELRSEMDDTIEWAQKLAA